MQLVDAGVELKGAQEEAARLMQELQEAKKSRDDNRAGVRVRGLLLCMFTGLHSLHGSATGGGMAVACVCMLP
jgi:hypothetical protein